MRHALIPLCAPALLVACVPDGPAPGPPPPAVKPPAPAAPRPRPAGAPATSAPPTSVATPAQAPSEDPPLTAPFKDDFERPSLGGDWASTGGAWRIEGGKLCVSHARNRGLWLRRRLPVNATIEFDATSYSPEGDIKAELWGDGRSAAEGVSYNDATSYLTIFGGWKNTFHVLARIDEHAPGRLEVRIDDTDDDLRARRVQPNRTYRFRVVRDDGKTVRWYVDDLEVLSLPDPQPLAGPGHDHFGFNDWDVRVCFDNLSITPLP